MVRFVVPLCGEFKKKRLPAASLEQSRGLRLRPRPTSPLAGTRARGRPRECRGMGPGRWSSCAEPPASPQASWHLPTARAPPARPGPLSAPADSALRSGLRLATQPRPRHGQLAVPASGRPSPAAAGSGCPGPHARLGCRRAARASAARRRRPRREHWQRARLLGAAGPWRARGLQLPRPVTRSRRTSLSALLSGAAPGQAAVPVKGP